MCIYIYEFFTRYIEIISGGKEKYRGTIHPEMIHRERLMEWFAKEKKIERFLTIYVEEKRESLIKKKSSRK